MRSVLSIAVLTCLLATGVAQAHRAGAPDPATPDVCLTNACSKATAVAPLSYDAAVGELYKRDEDLIAAATAAGVAEDVVRAGGTPGEVREVLSARCASQGGPTCAAARFFPGTEKFARLPDGGVGLTGQVGVRPPAEPVMTTVNLAGAVVP